MDSSHVAKEMKIWINLTILFHRIWNCRSGIGKIILTFFLLKKNVFFSFALKEQNIFRLGKEVDYYFINLTSQLFTVALLSNFQSSLRNL